MLTKATVLVAVVGSAAAQPMFVRYYDAAGPTAACNSAAKWQVTGPRGLCLTTPNNPASSYMVYCDGGNMGGLVAMCSDAVCGVCQSTPFTQPQQCLAVPAAIGLQLNSMDASCSNATGWEPIAPVLGQAVITYYPSADCSPSAEGYHTELLLNSGTCQTMNGAANQGIRVTANAAGSAGTYGICPAADCTGACINTAFVSGQCLPQVGASSVKIVLGVAASPSPTPSSTSSPSPSRAPRAPSASPADPSVAAANGAGEVAVAFLGLVVAVLAVAVTYAGMQPQKV